MISLVVTVLNEEGSIVELLDSVVAGTVVPDEVVIVDAGSSDGTVALIRRYAGEHDLKIGLIEQLGVNRSVGRNLGLASASGEVLALTDAGCRVDSQWLELLSKPFGEDERLMVARGGYRVVATNSLQRVAGMLTARQPDGDDYLSSSRSMAIRRDVWEQGYRYPEDLNTAEDLVFAYRLLALASVNVPEAVVDWRPQGGLWSVTKMFYGYSIGDGMARQRSPHWKNVWLRTMVFMTVPVLSIFGGLVGAAIGLLLVMAMWLRRLGILLVNTEQITLMDILVAAWLIPYLSVVTLVGYSVGVVRGLRSIGDAGLATG